MECQLGALRVLFRVPIQCHSVVVVVVSEHRVGLAKMLIPRENASRGIG